MTTTTNIVDLPPNPRFSQKTTQKNNISMQTNEVSPHQEISQHIQELTTKLPPRDIPREQSHLVQDESIKPNYIPKPREYQENYIQQEEKRRSFEQPHTSEDTQILKIYEEIEVPFFATILFFIFQMQFINKFIKKNFAYLYLTDNTLTLVGLVLKSGLFGLAFFALRRLINYLTEWNRKINKVFNSK
tara:strand:+ start:256 stop:819 length:564 start_codon:yes stop_codon:yes gene_type:complete